MQTRREFVRHAAALTGAAFAWGSIPEAIARALRIDPENGTTWRDAEHVVILMQENRSFDHCFGALRGVRGFRDPRVHRQPDGRPVWLQTDADGRTYAPFRLDLKHTNSTWIGGLPHSWPDQVAAHNDGRYDRWLVAKARDDRLPLTLGHYTRADIPFYYALADAFTVCDQAFCSSLTGTTPNRLYLWSGTLRNKPDDPARVFNDDADFVTPADWTTFPERLEQAGVTWRIYQNELTIPTGLSDEEEAWLSNYGDNPLEYFPQFRVRFARARRSFVARRLRELPAEIEARQATAPGATAAAEARRAFDEETARLHRELADLQREHATCNDAAWAALSPREQALHERAFTTNAGARHHRELARLTYRDGPTARSLRVPRGDIFHRFRSDVAAGKLPAVSWLVAPKEFSDHPSSAWFGAWYVSETLKILTENPDVWRKTIFILCYDENDGYFDHIPPFLAPHPDRPETGRASAGIDTTPETADRAGRRHSIGLGFRCPLVVASPWSRGGAVNSQVFDHTSILQFLERWFTEKGRPVHESNITRWRRTVCGDLTSVFRPYRGERYPLPQPLDRDATLVDVHKARFASPTRGADPLSEEQMGRLHIGAAQETGTRPSCPLPYELEANGRVEQNRLHLTLEARNRRFGAAAAGAPFSLYVYGAAMTLRSYAVRAGDTLEDSVALDSDYHVRLDGPNGFCREFRGTAHSPSIDVFAETTPDGIDLHATNRGSAPCPVALRDRSYGAASRDAMIEPGGSVRWKIGLEQNHGWYDVSVDAGDLSYRYSGRVETGDWSTSDPAMA